MARTPPPGPQPKSRIDIELLMAKGLTSSSTKAAPPGELKPSPQIAWTTLIAGVSHCSSLIRGGGGSGAASFFTGGLSSDGGSSAPSHQARKRCLNGAFGPVGDGFRFNSPKTDKISSWPPLAPARSDVALTRSHYHAAIIL